MKRIFFKFCILGLFVSSCSVQTKDPVKWVNPQLGATHCRWFFYTPAALPFGMAKLAPTTNAYGSRGSWFPNGYDDRHTSIEGFAHLHEFQIGGVVTTPTTGKLKTLPGTPEDPDSGYRSRFDKATETSEPGYYSVVLADYNIKAELTATERVGYHRYTYPQSETSRILFDIGHPQGESGPVVDAHVAYDESTQSVNGWVECYSEYAREYGDPNNHCKSYFYARLSKSATTVGTYRDSEVHAGQTSISGKGIGLYVEFPTQKDEEVEMQVGVSYTSVANAKMNLEAETKGMTFDKVHANARKRWNDILSRIEVEGGSDTDKTKFYTALYHALLGRGIANDVDGSYITHNKQIAKIECDRKGKPLYSHHNTDGVWGGFWNLTQVWALAYPEVYDSYVRSTLDFSKHTDGWLHDGEAAGVFTNGVQTNFQGLIASAAYNAGVYKGDKEYLWKAVRQNELGYEGRPMGAGRYDNKWFVEQGYVPVFAKDRPGPHNFGVSHTFEYCFAAYAASQLAESLGKEEDARLFREKADGYRILFDDSTGCMRPREERGEFIHNFNPMRAWGAYQEGNAVQYTWYVPHDVKGLISLLGKEEFNRRLEQTFMESSKTEYGGKPGEFDSFSGVELLYNHGNQPCLHNVWLFNYSQKPWLTQYYSRDICRQFYGTEPTHGYGYGQDEDQGQIGGWYVLAAMGLFDVQGLTNRNATMQIGSPLFDKVTIHLNKDYYSGKKFTIQVENNTDPACYIQKAMLNGKELNRCFIPLKDIQQGGTLKLTMGTTPNEQWGIEACPPSMSDEK